MQSNIAPWAFVLAVPDIDKSAQYFRNVLGFRISWNWFGYLEVDDVDSLYTEFTARGAVCTAPKDTHYGMREIVITTTDGHRLVCGQPSKRT